MAETVAGTPATVLIKIHFMKQIHKTILIGVAVFAAIALGVWYTYYLFSHGQFGY